MNHITDINQVIDALSTKGVCIGKVKPQTYHRWKQELQDTLNCPVLSKSTLAAFAANPYRWHHEQVNDIRKTSDVMALGSLVDTLTLTPELFSEQYRIDQKRVALKKDGTPYANGMQDPDQKIEWQALAESGITIVTPEQHAEAMGIVEVASNAITAHGMLIGENCHTQVAVWARVTQFDGRPLACPVILCCLMDITNASDRITDLKSTSVDVANVTKLCYLMEDLRYGMQAAIYTDCLSMATGESDITFDFLFVGTAHPHQTRYIRMTSDALELYRREYKSAVRKFADCWKIEEWGEADLAVVYYTPSQREYNLVEERESV